MNRRELLSTLFAASLPGTAPGFPQEPPCLSQPYHPDMDNDPLQERIVLGLRYTIQACVQLLATDPREHVCPDEDPKPSRCCEECGFRADLACGILWALRGFESSLACQLMPFGNDLQVVEKRLVALLEQQRAAPPEGTPLLDIMRETA